MIANPVTLHSMIEAAFNQIHQFGRTNAAVTIRLLEAIAAVAERAQDSETRTTLLEQAMMIERGSREGLLEDHDRRDVHERYVGVLNALER